MKLRILGPPGTGKTTKLMELLEMELEKGTSPNKVSFLTFTRAARFEALARTGKKEEDFPFLRTIHAICYRQLNIEQTQMVKPASLRGFGKKMGLKLNGNQIDPWVEEHQRSWEPPTRDDLLLQANHLGRHRGLLLKESIQLASPDIDYKYAVWFTKAYRAWKEADGMMDYTDLLTRYLDYGKPLDIDVMFVDEAQDLSQLQWDVVEKLGVNARRWYIAGDDDQAIFNWAGADSSVFQDLIVDKTVTLDQSFRVSKTIHRFAHKVTDRMAKRLSKEYKPTESEGDFYSVGHLHGADYKDKTFILFRNHYRGHALARELSEDGIPFIGSGSCLNDFNVRQALLAWYTLFRKGEIPAELVKRMMKFVDIEQTHIQINSTLKKSSILRLDDIFIRRPNWQDWKTYLSGLPAKEEIAHFVRTAGFKRTIKPNVELLSIHQSKGRQAHTVVLDVEMSRQTWESMTRTVDDDEHRVWYVGITRAKERLIRIMPESVYSYPLE